jgi:acyl-CoA synthetase (AMP-forming)/AMP-acid ligase II
MHPADMIFFWARSNPERPALIQPNMAVTYRELAEAIESVSERIERYSFNKQEPIAVSITEPIQKLAVCFALLRSGISVAPINQTTLPHLRPNGINNVIYTGEGLMLSGGRNIRFEDTWFKGAIKLPVSRGPSDGSHAMQADILFFQMAASGLPKKLFVPGGALVAMAATLPLTGETSFTRSLVGESINSTSGFGRVVMNLYAGKTACFAGDYENQRQLINTFNVESLSCTARQASDLISVIEKNRGRFDSLQEIWIESGPVSDDLVWRMQANLCRNIVIGYGSAEAGRIAFAHHDTIADVHGAVGFVAPYVNLEIVDESDVQVTPGEEGRVRCRTKYFSKIFSANNPEQAGATHETWYYPGDRGRIAGDGILCISGKSTT